jgi:subtilisin family serine protease
MPPGLKTKKVEEDPDWILEFANFTEAWNTPLRLDRPLGKQKGEGVVVVQADTGWTGHPEVAGDRYLIGQARNFYKDWGRPGRILIGEALTEPDAPYMAIDSNLGSDTAGHGTATASVLMSGENPPQAANAVWGVAPKSELIPFRVATDPVVFDQAGMALARSIFYVVGEMDTTKIGVITVSLGTHTIVIKESKIVAALKAAREKGIIVCAAAGQIPRKDQDQDMELWPKWNKALRPAFPARDANVICVGGCRPNMKFAPLVSAFYGPEIYITAPASRLWIARTKEVGPAKNLVYSVERSSGTSYATAIVAGACALWQAYHGRSWLLANYGPELIFPLFKEVLKRSAFKPTGWDAANRGVGVLDAERLLLEELPPKDDPSLHQE